MLLYPKSRIELVGGPEHGAKVPAYLSWLVVECESGDKATYQLMRCHREGKDYYVFIGYNTPTLINPYTLKKANDLAE